MPEYRLHPDIDWHALDGQDVRVLCLPEALLLALDNKRVVILGRPIHRRPAGRSDLAPAVDPETWREGASDALFNRTDAALGNGHEDA
jgi:hypothetical protein